MASNTFGIMKICSRQGWSEPVGVYYSARPGGLEGVSFRLSLMIVYCMFSLESPHRGDFIEYTQCTLNVPFFNMAKKYTLTFCKFAAMGFFLGTQERVRYSRGR